MIFIRGFVVGFRDFQIAGIMKKIFAINKLRNPNQIKIKENEKNNIIHCNHINMYVS